MVILFLLLSVAQANRVQCDALEAAAVLAEARVDERRAPISHPELIPGLALASARTGTDLRAALADLCDDEANLSLTRSDRWDDAGWSAHAFLLTRSETVGCTLFQRTIAISVGISDRAAPRYRLRARLPVTRTPVGDCPTLPTWREEEILGGEGGPVHLVLATHLEDDELLYSEVLARRASPDGWSDQRILEPAPPRLVGGDRGPRVTLTERYEDKWIVVHGDRTSAPPECEPIPGQTVWTWGGDAWEPHAGREALRLLAKRGLWRLAGEDAWLLILHQADEGDRERLEWHTERLQRGSPEPLHLFSSAQLPGLNPGFLVVAPAPWPTEEEAREARPRAPRWRRSYVKQAWTAPDPCAPDQQP